MSKNENKNYDEFIEELEEVKTIEDYDKKIKDMEAYAKELKKIKKRKKKMMELEMEKEEILKKINKVEKNKRK